MPKWYRKFTAKFFQDKAIARSLEISAMTVNDQLHTIQGPSSPTQRDFAAPLRSRPKITGGGLVGGINDLESSGPPSVRENVNRFEGWEQSSHRQRIGSDAVASGSGIVSGSMPHAGSAIGDEYLNVSINSMRPPHPFNNELIRKAQARNLRLFGSLDPSPNLVNYPEHPFRDPSLGGAIYQPLHFKAAPTRVPVKVVPSLTPPVGPQAFQSSSMAYRLRLELEARRVKLNSSDSLDSLDDLSSEWAD